MGKKGFLIKFAKPPAIQNIFQIHWLMSISFNGFPQSKIFLLQLFRHIFRCRRFNLHKRLLCLFHCHVIVIFIQIRNRSGKQLLYFFSVLSTRALAIRSFDELRQMLLRLLQSNEACSRKRPKSGDCSKPSRRAFGFSRLFKIWISPICQLAKRLSVKLSSRKCSPPISIFPCRTLIPLLLSPLGKGATKFVISVPPQLNQALKCLSSLRTSW